MARKLSDQKRALTESATALKLGGPDFSKLKCEQPLADPDAFQRARVDEEAQAPFKDPRHIGIIGGGG